MSDSAVIDPRSFRDALGAFTTGVTIVTTRDAQGNDIGLTANSFNSVSLDPPLVLWSLAKSSLSLSAFVESNFFAVHILSSDQQSLSDLFARRGADKFSGMTLKRGHGNVPLLEGCSARFECETAFRHDGGDHEIFVGRVISFENFQRAPLVFMGGKYAVALQKPSVSKPEAIVDAASISTDSLHYLIANAHFLLDQNSRSLMHSYGINQSQLYGLLLLGASSPKSLEQIDSALNVTGQEFSRRDADGLLKQNYIREIDGSFDLTELGQTLLMESAAVIKAGEEEAQREFEFSETQILRLLLKRLVRGLYVAQKQS